MSLFSSVCDGALVKIILLSNKIGLNSFLLEFRKGVTAIPDRVINSWRTWATKKKSDKGGQKNWTFRERGKGRKVKFCDED